MKSGRVDGGIVVIDEFFLGGEGQGSLKHPDPTVRMQAMKVDLGALVAAAADRRTQVRLEGYGDRMPLGLPVHLPSYSSAELAAIFDEMAGRRGLALTAEGRDAALAQLDARRSSPGFANAGAVAALVDELAKKR